MVHQWLPTDFRVNRSLSLSTPVHVKLRSCLRREIRIAATDITRNQPIDEATVSTIGRKLQNRGLTGGGARYTELAPSIEGPTHSKQAARLSGSVRLAN